MHIGIGVAALKMILRMGLPILFSLLRLKTTDMQFFETLFLIQTFLFLFFISFYGEKRKWHLLIFRIGLCLILLHFVFEIARWQVGLSYLLFLFLALLLLKKSIAPLFFRILGFMFGMLLIGASIHYAIGMPMIKLPVPSGMHQVGTRSFNLIDQSRDELHTHDPDDKRELFVEVWYPAKFSPGQKKPEAQSLWQELYIGKIDRVSFFMDYLKGISTHSYINAIPDLSNGPYPVILFNHGLQMFTSQNTLLMEHLASHGYILVSVAHPYESLRVNLSEKGAVLPEFITSMEKFKAAMDWVQKTSAPIEAAKEAIKNVDSRVERAKILLKAIEASPLNQVVENWVEDNRFVLDHLLAATNNELPFSKAIDQSKIGVMGMSIGGATATELSKSDTRIKAAINIDGLQYGFRNHEPLKVPFMMIYSKDGQDLNDFLFLGTDQDIYKYTIPDALHSDFTDLTVVWPIMKMYGQLGNITGKRMIHLTNLLTLNFWDHYLKNKPLQTLHKEDFPEVFPPSTFE